MTMSVCLFVHEYISEITRAIFTIFLCLLPTSMARSYPDMFTIGCMAYRRERIFFQIVEAYILSLELHARSLPFLCMLPMSVARSSSDMFTTGCIAYRREGVLFPIEDALSVGKGGCECTARAKYAIYTTALFHCCRATKFAVGVAVLLRSCERIRLRLLQQFAIIHAGVRL